MPRRGMARWVWQPGAASAGAGLPPANFLRCPSGTGSSNRNFLDYSHPLQLRLTPPRAFKQKGGSEVRILPTKVSQCVNRVTRARG